MNRIARSASHQVVLFAAFGITLLAAGCEPASATWGATADSRSSFREKGTREATDAVAAGVLKLKEYPPLPSPAWQGNYIRLLKERCGVDYEVPHKPDGVAEADFVEEIRGWNSVMEAEISKRFGDDILQKLREESQPPRKRKGPGIKA